MEHDSTLQTRRMIGHGHGQLTTNRNTGACRYQKHFSGSSLKTNRNEQNM